VKEAPLAVESEVLWRRFFEIGLIPQAYTLESAACPDKISR
jgi:hypothetical protein